jgi:hypothetical protein
MSFTVHIFASAPALLFTLVLTRVLACVLACDRRGGPVLARLAHAVRPHFTTETHDESAETQLSAARSVLLITSDQRSSAKVSTRQTNPWPGIISTRPDREGPDAPP